MEVETDYDYIVLGTGLTECILGGLLSATGKKVLTIDRNTYYGGESTSLNLEQFFAKFRPGQSSKDANLGKERDWNIDLIPKFMMANGEIIRFLTYTDVTRYLEFKQIAGSYVYSGGRVYKVPSNETEALTSSLFGIFEKRRAKKFLEWVQSYNFEQPTTWQGLDANVATAEQVFDKFGLAPHSREFVGHSMALYLDDQYLKQPAKDLIERVRLYAASMARYGKSPYLYPLYGLGDLPQGFARFSAVHGGTYMLGTEVREIIYDDDGKFTGVRAACEQIGCEVTFKAKALICDPSYVPDKVSQVGSVVRAICMFKHPIADTHNSDSVQIVIPQGQVNRKHDIYVACVSSSHKVCAQDYYTAIVSTIVETSTPERELLPGLNLLQPIVDKFVSVSPLEEPKEDGSKDNVFISKSYDATSHFETVCQDVDDLYKRITGTPLVLEKPKQEE